MENKNAILGIVLLLSSIIVLLAMGIEYFAMDRYSGVGITAFIILAAIGLITTVSTIEGV